MENNTPVNKQSGSLPLLEYANGFRGEVNSSFNEWVTGEKVGHTPTWDEKLVHFVMHGGARAYRKRFLETHQGLVLS